MFACKDYEASSAAPLTCCRRRRPRAADISNGAILVPSCVPKSKLVGSQWAYNPFYPSARRFLYSMSPVFLAVSSTSCVLIMDLRSVCLEIQSGNNLGGLRVEDCSYVRVLCSSSPTGYPSNEHWAMKGLLYLGIGF